VACTGELSPEREVVHDIANELNKILANEFGIFLEVVDWTTHVLPLMGRPQQVIFDSIPVNSWDVLICMLWLRFGTPTGEVNRRNDEPFLSGTEEEFTLAYQYWSSQKGKPKILVYRCTRPASPLQVDPEQLSRVEAFFGRFGADGPNPGLVQAFDSTEQFEKLIQSALTKIVLEVGQKARPRETLQESQEAEAARLPPDEGLLGFYTPRMNDLRNQKKRKALRAESKLVRLVAFVGHSYLAKVGNRFADEVIALLEGGGHFQALILNPWSEDGLMIAIGESDQKIGNLDFSLPRVDLSQVDVSSVIEESIYYKYSLTQVIEESDVLRRRYGDRFEVRLTTYPIPATMLLTTSMGFFEPYISVDLRQRLRKAFHTFEVQFSSESYLHQHTSTYFDTLWKLSEPLSEFREREQVHRQRLVNAFALRLPPAKLRRRSGRSNK
jgi:stress-induced morphogen